MLLIRNITNGILEIKNEELAEIFKESTYSIPNLFRVIIFKIDAILTYLHNINRFSNYESGGNVSRDFGVEEETVHIDNDYILSDNDIIKMKEGLRMQRLKL